MNSKIILLIATVVTLALGSCKTPTTISNEYASAGFDVTCMGVDPDGTQTLRSWGNGISKDKAIEQAKRRAVETVIFDGITGTGDCDKRPLVTEVNARERYETYFNAFFREGGAYNKYVTLEEKRTSRLKSSNSSMEAWGVVVKVNRSALKARLRDDNVIR